MLIFVSFVLNSKAFKGGENVKKIFFHLKAKPHTHTHHAKTVQTISTVYDDGDFDWEVEWNPKIGTRSETLAHE